MDVSIKGFQKVSMIDYPGLMASVLFLADCNFRCPFCQNPDLINNTEKLPDVPVEEVLAYISSKRGWIDGVCVTGGEPTLHRGLPELCRKLKESGMKVKLDTNGTNPGMVEGLIKEGLIDFIAMDIKGPLPRYSEIACVPVNTKNIEKSVKLIRSSGLVYEFRTTVVPRLLKDGDIGEIGKWLSGSEMYALQQFRPMITLDPAYEKETSYSEPRMKALGKMAAKYFRKVEVRT